MEQTKKMSESQVLAKIKKFEKRNPGHHEIPFVLSKCIRQLRRTPMSKWGDDPLAKIIKPIPEEVKWPGDYVHSPRQWEYAQDFHYDSELRMLRISFLRIDAHWGADMNRDWVRVDPSYYVDIDTCDVYDNLGTLMSRRSSYFTVYFSYGKADRRWASAYMYGSPVGSVLREIHDAMLNDNPSLQRNMDDWTQKQLNDGNCPSWLIMRTLRKSPGNQKLKKTKRDLEIDRFHDACEKDPVRIHNGEYIGKKGSDRIYTVERYGEDKKRPIYLIRIYDMPRVWENRALVYCSNKATESARIYFTNKSSTYFKRVKSGGGIVKWVYHQHIETYAQMADFQDYKDNTFCSERLGGSRVGPSSIVKIAKNKYAEQLAAVGAYQIAAYLVETYTNPDKLYGRFHVFVSEAKGKTVFQWLKITPEQVQMIENYHIAVNSQREYWTTCCGIINVLRSIFGDQLSSYDDAIGPAIPYAYDPPYDVTEMYGVLVKKVCKISETPLVRTVNDTAAMMNNIALDENNMPVDWRKEIKKIKSVNDLYNIHDRCTRIINILAERRRQNAEKEEREEEARYVAKYLPKLEKAYEYENEHFMIVVPKSKAEIQTEGSRLHHCVAGYAMRHVRRSTTILFVRKKEHLNEPFYTIEVQDNRVIQIHGMCNKWIGNDPDAARFVWHWAKDKDVCLDETIVLNTGTGYARGGAYLPKSELY